MHVQGFPTTIGFPVLRMPEECSMSGGPHVCALTISFTHHISVAPCVRTKGRAGTCTNGLQALNPSTIVAVKCL